LSYARYTSGVPEDAAFPVPALVSLYSAVEQTVGAANAAEIKGLAGRPGLEPG